MGYSVAWGKLIHEKNLKSKISWHCPFNPSNIKAEDILDSSMSNMILWSYREVGHDYMGARGVAEHVLGPVVQHHLTRYACEQK